MVGPDALDLRTGLSRVIWNRGFLEHNGISKGRDHIWVEILTCWCWDTRACKHHDIGGGIFDVLRDGFNGSLRQGLGDHVVSEVSFVGLFCTHDFWLFVKNLLWSWVEESWYQWPARCGFLELSWACHACVGEFKCDMRHFCDSIELNDLCACRAAFSAVLKVRIEALSLFFFSYSFTMLPWTFDIHPPVVNHNRLLLRSHENVASQLMPLGSSIFSLVIAYFRSCLK